ncbi:MAG: SpoVA/SpoVAEb family sporulation membrane protein [Clostridia bacterium]|nr:SpoVA/SpoVAEb family sporulation membrane protein [Clostridia bacterium]
MQSRLADVTKNCKLAYFCIGTKIFTIAGPVIMYGTVASVVYGVIYWFMNII